MRTVTQIIEACGGPEAIEAAAGPHPTKDGKPKLSHWAIRKWPQSGIPEWHWPLLMGLSDLTVEELHAANEAARQVAA